jgi:hypothetical protein
MRFGCPICGVFVVVDNELARIDTVLLAGGRVALLAEVLRLKFR